MAPRTFRSLDRAKIAAKQLVDALEQFPIDRALLVADLKEQYGIGSQCATAAIRAAMEEDTRGLFEEKESGGDRRYLIMRNPSQPSGMASMAGEGVVKVAVEVAQDDDLHAETHADL